MRKPLRPTCDDPHTLLEGFLVLIHTGNSFRPAPYSGKRSSQLMGYRRYELILHLFRIRKLLRHVVDRVAKLAKLVISFLFKTFAEISRSIPPCYAVYASYRQNNRFDKKHSREKHEHYDSHNDSRDYHRHNKDLMVDIFHGRQHSQCFIFASLRGYDWCYRHDLFPCWQLIYLCAYSRVGLLCVLIIGHVVILRGREAWWCNIDLTVGLDSHKLYLVFLVIAFHKGAYLRIIVSLLVTWSVHYRRGDYLHFRCKILPCGTVVIISHHHDKQYFKHHKYSHDHPEIVPQPVLCDTESAAFSFFSAQLIKTPFIMFSQLS